MDEMSDFRNRGGRLMMRRLIRPRRTCSRWYARDQICQLIEKRLPGLSRLNTASMKLTNSRRQISFRHARSSTYLVGARGTLSVTSRSELVFSFVVLFCVTTLLLACIRLYVLRR